LIIDCLIFLALLLVFFFIDTIYVKLTPEELYQFKIVYIIAATYSVIHFPFVTLNGILTGYEKFVQLKLADVIQRVLIVGLTVAALLMGLGLYAMVAVRICYRNMYAFLIKVRKACARQWSGSGMPMR